MEWEMAQTIQELEHKIAQLETSVANADANNVTYEQLLKKILAELDEMCEMYPYAIFEENGLVFHSLAENLIRQIEEALA